MTAAELRAAQRAHEAASAKGGSTLQARNEAIHEALAEGWTHAAIAEATGLTRGRIGQLAMHNPKETPKP